MGRTPTGRMVGKDSTRKEEPRYAEKRLQVDLGKGKYSTVTEVWHVWKGAVQDKAGTVGWLYQNEYQTEVFVCYSAGRRIRSGFRGYSPSYRIK